MLNTQDRIDLIRYRRILRFFAGIISRIIVWDLVATRIPLLRTKARSSRPNRQRVMARQFRGVAIEMGGVLIKLGQFLSTRVDVLPAEITGELQGLQDEVPPVDNQQIFALLSSELGDGIQRFESIDPEPIAAASLGQVYRARLCPDEAGDGHAAQVVIKVQRPNIADVVRTDLAALRVVAGWAMHYKPISRRANLTALLDEFAHTLWLELDYVSEADNAERFAAIHADDPRIYIPHVYRQLSTERVLVLEDVTAIKIADVEAIRAAGIDTKAVADLLLDAYYKQVFEADFFHADPHPGNLFVRPMPGNNAPGSGPEEPESMPFQLVFVDFGMAVQVPPSVGENLRKLLIAVTQQNARGLTDAFQELGFFLPGTDLDRVTEAVTIVLDRVWGRDLLELARPDPREVEELGREFRDILFEFPFQVPQDFIYLGRALGMVSGLVSQLDPQINPWHQIERYGRALIGGQSRRRLSDLNLQAVVELMRPYLETPSRIQRLLEDAEKGRLKVQVAPDRETIRHQERVEKRLGQLGLSIVAAAGIVSATLVFLDRKPGARK